MVSTTPYSSSNSPSSRGRRGQPTVMTMSFICDQIDTRLNDIVKPMVHNEIQVAQQQANVRDNSTLAVPWENIASSNASNNQPRGKLPSCQTGNTDK